VAHLNGWDCWCNIDKLDGVIMCAIFVNWVGYLSDLLIWVGCWGQYL
jgi:hypothetical protein